MTELVNVDYAAGAHNAVRVCLNIQPHERVTVITDRICQEIAASLIAEIEAVGAPYKAFVLEDLAVRPLEHLPAAIAEHMEQSQVSIFCARAQANELLSRMEMTDIVNRRKMRHAHMVNISHDIMLQGMRADFHKVDAISRRSSTSSRRPTDPRTTPAGSDHADAIELPLDQNERPISPRWATSPAAKCSPRRVK
jgi:leucyl aminopeptidase (aminopeptidase T)